jgi:AraC-like DNA-binding protein
MAHELRLRPLFGSSVVSIADVCCRARESGCGPEETSFAHSIAIPRRGVFVRHLGRTETVGDANCAVFFNRLEPYRVSHPLAGGDDCTSFHFSPDVLNEAVRAHQGERDAHPDRPFAHTHGPLSPRTFLLCQRLRQELLAEPSDALRVDEVALCLLNAVLHESHAARGDQALRVRSSTAQAHRKWAESARVVLNRRVGERVLLGEVAKEVHCSPFHLVRVFRRHVGLPIHRYLNRLRLRLAVQRLVEGERRLTELALDLGFSSHAHFCDAFHREFGSPPSGLRRSLGRDRLHEISKNLEA